MKRKWIAVFHKGSVVKVKAYREDYLTIHKIIGTEETKYLWTITHVQTGLCVGMEYPPFRTLKEAKEMVLELTKEDNWYIKGAKFGKVNTLPVARILDLFDIMLSAWELLTGITTEESRRNTKKLMNQG